MSEIAIETLVITTTGGAGAATGSTDSVPFKGFLLDVFLNYAPGAPATTDVTISDPVFGNICVKSNNAADVWLAPRKDTVDTAAAATGNYDLVPIHAGLTIAVAGCDALDPALTATIRYITP